MKLSAVIPTFNGRWYLDTQLKSLNNQTLRLNDLLIIDSSSSDGTNQLLEKENIQFITIPIQDFDHGGTRSLGVKRTTGDIIVFLTQDALPFDNNSLENLTQVFSNPKIGAAFGRQLPYPNETPFGTHLRLFNYTDKSYERSYDDKHTYGIKTAFLSDSFSAYRREALEKIGLFKDSLICSEDLYAGAKILKAGYSLAYVANAKVYHSHGYSIREEFKRYFDIGVLHQQEKWLLEEFGKPEGEGKRYAISEIRYLAKLNKFHLIPISFIRSGTKYLGYSLGKINKSLPIKLNRKISMNKNWWYKCSM